MECDPNDLVSLALYLPLILPVTADPDELRSEADRLVDQTKDKATVLLVAYTALRNAGLSEAPSYLRRAVELGPDTVRIPLMAAREAIDTDPVTAQKYLERVSETGTR